MSRPAVKNAVRLAIFAAAIATAACTDATAPTSTINLKNKALKDTVAVGDSSGFCKSGWVIQGGRLTCENG